MDKTVKYTAIVAIVIGILGIGYLYYTGTQGIPIARAQTISKNYLDSIGTTDLEIAEIMEFEHNYYVVYIEESTGIGAMEMLIDKTTGRIFPEYGPNMMWNLKYGHGGMMTSPGGMMRGFGGIMGGYYPEGYSDRRRSYGNSSKIPRYSVPWSRSRRPSSILRILYNTHN
jgi:hypothetical protein